MAQSGCVHIYTGTGKGKTTAALGLTLRAVGAGWKVCFIRFLKPRPSAEYKPLRKLPGVTVLSFSGPAWIRRQKPTQQDRQQAQRGLAALTHALVCGRYRLVVADEACTAVHLGVLTEAELLQSLEARPQAVELVLTGRGASPGVKRKAHLITDMREVKHYYRQGMPARLGIEY